MPAPFANGISLGGCHALGGAGAPEGSIAAPPGSIYLRTNGQIYRKGSGTGNTGWTELSAVVQQVNISWTGDGPAEFLTLTACTLSNPTLRGGGTPSVAYSYAADGVTFNATPSFPLTMAAGSVLRVTLSGFNTRAAWAAERR